ncbi:MULTISPECIES: YidB family protein [unclassified Streptomyces]|uniref:YidB family protein n=1 Tax=unclassified Streptomyces TaxID=2593676 RepID=UPI00371276C6
MAGNDLESMLGSLLGGEGKGAGLLTALIAAMSHGQGGGSLGGLLDSLARSGLTAQKDSWVGTGANQPVTGDQLQQALPDDTLQQVAEETGTTPEQAADQLARVLPDAVDRLTPEGAVPKASIEDLIRRQSR